MDSQKIKVGIFAAGANVKIIGEHDLTSQKFSHRNSEIYLVDLAMSRDPRYPISQVEIDKYITSVKNAFRDNRYTFKTQSITDAEAFIKFKTKGDWTVIKEFDFI